MRVNDRCVVVADRVHDGVEIRGQDVCGVGEQQESGQDRLRSRGLERDPTAHQLNAMCAQFVTAR
jgi:hypothetical protein